MIRNTWLQRLTVAALALGLLACGVPAYAEPPTAPPETAVTDTRPREESGSSERESARAEEDSAGTPARTPGDPGDPRDNAPDRDTSSQERRGKTAENPENGAATGTATFPRESREASGLAELRNGHMDAFYVTRADGQLQLRLKEDITGTGVVRSPESAVMVMGENWYVKDLDWRLPGCENAGYSSTQLSGQMLFPGWSSSDFASDGFERVRVAFTEVSAPEGGRIALVNSALDGSMHPVLRSGNFYIAPGAELAITTRGHQHFHWLFTKPGRYQFKAKAVGTLAGETVESPEVTYTWVAEGQPADFDPVGKDPQCQPWTPNPADYPDDDEATPPIVPQGDGKPVLAAGHLDVFYVSARGSEVTLSTKEDITGTGVIRPAESYYLRVEDNAKVSVPARMSTQLAPAGYLLAENGAQQSQMLFPGWDTNGVAPKFQSVDLSFEEVSGPGKVFLFHNAASSGGSIKSALKSGGYEVTAGETIHQPFPAHAHVNWLFEKPGVYTMKVFAYALSPQGDEAESNVATYTWIVGDATPLPGDAAAGTPGNTGKPGSGSGQPGLDLVGKPGKGGAAGGGAVPGIKGKKGAKKAAPPVGRPAGKNTRKPVGKKAGLQPGKKGGKAAKPGKPAPKRGTVAPGAAKGRNAAVKPRGSGGAGGFGAVAPAGFPAGGGLPEFGGQAGMLPGWSAGGGNAGDSSWFQGASGFPALAGNQSAAGLPGFAPDAAGVNDPGSGDQAGAGAIPGQPAPESPRPASSLAPHEQLSATGRNPYGSAVVRESPGLDPLSLFLLGGGIAAGLAGVGLLASRRPLNTRGHLRERIK